MMEIDTVKSDSPDRKFAGSCELGGGVIEIVRRWLATRRDHLRLTR